MAHETHSTQLDLRLTPEGVILSVNDAVLALGYQENDLVGQPFDMLVHPNDHRKLRAHLLPRAGATSSRKDVVLRVRVSISRDEGTLPDEDQRPHCLYQFSALFLRNEDHEMAVVRLTGRAAGGVAIADRLLRQAVGTAAMGVVTLNEQGDIQEANDLARDLLGYGSCHKEDLSLYDLIPKDDRSALRHAMRRCLSGNRGMADVRGGCNDGLQVHMRVFLQQPPWMRKQRQLLATLIDTTDLAEQASSDSLHMAMLDETYNTAEQAVLLLRDELIVDCNPSAFELFRTESPDQLLGAALAEVSLEQETVRMRMFDQVPAGAPRGTHQRFQWMFKRADGTSFPASTYLTSLGPELGNARMLMISDVGALDHHTQLHRYLVELANEFIAISPGDLPNVMPMHLQVIADLLKVDVVAAFTAVAESPDWLECEFSWLPGERSGAADNDTDAERDRRLYLGDDLANGGGVNLIQAEDRSDVTPPENMTLFVQLSIHAMHAVVFRDEGRVTGALLIGKRDPCTWSRETTESLQLIASVFDSLWKRREALNKETRLTHQLLQAQKMESVGQVTGGIAHDFNNLLSVIMGNLDVANLLYDQGMMTKEKGLELISNIRQSAEMASSMTKRLLLFSRSSVQEVKPLRVNEQVESMERLLHRITPARIQRNFVLDEAQPMVTMDPLHLQQLLLNLWVNAVDATPGQGTVTVTTGTMETQGQATCGICHRAVEGEWAYVAVRDTGTGIPDEIRDKLFEAFFTTKGEGKGTGLGLATVSGIVREYKGHLLLDSTVGEGTAFTALLPVATPAEGVTDANALGLLRENQSSDYIVLLEDNKALCASIEQFLHLLNYTVYTFHTLADARAWVLESKTLPDFYIGDYSLSDGTGFELLDDMGPSFDPRRVLMVTGYGDDPNFQAEIERRQVRVLLKPFSGRQLLSTVREALENLQEQGDGQE